jgi:hypothetical protein
MSLINGFDAATVEPAAEYKPLPEGEYVCIIAASEEKQTASGNGEYLKLTLEVVDGEHKGRQLFDNLNLLNPNQQTVEIAQKTLSAICRAVGVMRPQHPMELHSKPLIASVKCEKRKDNGELSNRIKAYKATGGAAPQPAAGVPWAK